MFECRQEHSLLHVEILWGYHEQCQRDQDSLQGYSKAAKYFNLALAGQLNMAETWMKEPVKNDLQPKALKQINV